MPRTDEPVCLACEGCPVCDANPACCMDCTGGEVVEGPVKFCECEGHTCGPAPEDVDPAVLVSQDIKPPMPSALANAIGGPGTAAPAYSPGLR